MRAPSQTLLSRLNLDSGWLSSGHQRFLKCGGKIRHCPLVFSFTLNLRLAAFHLGTYRHPCRRKPALFDRAFLLGDARLFLLLLFRQFRLTVRLKVQFVESPNGQPFPFLCGVPSAYTFCGATRPHFLLLR